MPKKIVYIGPRDIKEDNVASTGLIWTHGEIHEVTDEKKAAMLLAHPTVWADAEKDYKVTPMVHAEPQKAEPLIHIIPQGGEKVDLHWQPIPVPVDADTYNRVRDKELDVYFMSAEDAEAFKAFKGERVKRVAQAEKMRDAKAAKKQGLEAQPA